MTGAVRREAETTAETEAEIRREIGMIEEGTAENGAEGAMKEEVEATAAVETEAVAGQTPAAAVLRVVRRKLSYPVRKSAATLWWRKVRSPALPRMSLR